MIGASSEFELVEFEQVELAPGTALLRVTARPGLDPATEAPALLIADSGRENHRFSPQPSPPSPPGTLRLAFTAPTELVDRGTTFALELADGSVVRLPAPSRRRPAHGQDGIAAEAERRRLADAERLRALEAERLRAVEAERERAVEVERLRAERDQALADRNRALNERNVAVADRDQVESRARAAAAGAGALEAQARSANEAAGRMRTELEAAQTEREAALADRRAARAQLEGIQTQRDQAQAELRATQADRESARAELEAARQEADTHRGKVIELSEQIAAVRAEMEALRADEARAGSDRMRVLEEALVVRDAEIELLNATVGDLVGHYEEHADARERAAAQVELLEGARAKLSEDHQRLSGEHAQLSDERARLLEEHGRLLDDHGRLLDERAGLQARADQLFVQLEDARTGTLAALDLLRDALLERLHQG